MDKASTYTLLGIPEGVSTALALICLSLALAPWLGGTELGPLKIPQLGAPIRWLRVAGPAAFLLAILGFVRIWPSPSDKTPSPVAAPGLSNQGRLITLGEIESEVLRNDFGMSKWEGGPHWGKILFDQSGRIATYTNEPGRSPGRILLQGEPNSGTVPLLIGEWHQQDRQGGDLFVEFPRMEGVEIIPHEHAPGTLHIVTSTLHVKWGPDHAVESIWKRLP